MNQIKIVLVASVLKKYFSDFNHYNKKNPLSELLFIICSITTTYPVYVRTYKALRSKYRKFNSLHKASTRQIAAALYEGGQFDQKARVIKKIFKMLVKRFGRPTLAPLRKMDDKQCESMLLSLPGVGKKVARCVMLYSLNRKVFPVDTHCWRITKRLGWIKGSKITAEATDKLQNLIPRNLRYSLHVNLISLGRKFCKAKEPFCLSCPVTDLCPKIGL